MKDTQNLAPSYLYQNLPLVVIVGRPNVGKSTLFNRLLHKRLAITDPTPGVTRDPVEAVASICDKPVRLVDTGGFKLEHNNNDTEIVMDKLVVSRTLQTLKLADMILLLLDATNINFEDEEFIKLLRPYQAKLLVAVNKTEGGRLQDSAWNYMQYGFKELLFISAEHGDNIAELEANIVSKLDFSSVTKAEPFRSIRISILGKPNTGKSTLCNTLSHTSSSIVSSIAGTTRDVVEATFRHNGQDFVIMDTAGIRRKSKVYDNVEYYSVNRAIKTVNACDIVFLVIDCQEGISEQDKKICSHAFNKGRGIIFVLNKWDTQPKGIKILKKAQENLRFAFPQMQFAPIVAISAKNAEGIKNLMDTTLDIYAQLTKKTETSTLNLACKQWLSKCPPPAKKTSSNFKLRYMVQTSTNPVRFLIFVTKPNNIPYTYMSFLQNRIREDLGYNFIPIKLDFKASRSKWEERNL